MTSNYLWQAVGLDPIPEFQFAKPRKWKFDFAWPDKLVALELEGGIWTRGRHIRGKGYLNDMEKYSMAAILGWCVIRIHPSDIQTKGIDWVVLALSIRGQRAQFAETQWVLEKADALNA